MLCITTDHSWLLRTRNSNPTNCPLPLYGLRRIVLHLWLSLQRVILSLQNIRSYNKVCQASHFAWKTLHSLSDSDADSGYESFSCHFQWCSISMHLWTLRYAWKIPGRDLVDQTKVSQVFSKLNEQQAAYSTCAMCQEFLDKYNHTASCKNVAMKHLPHSPWRKIQCLHLCWEQSRWASGKRSCWLGRLWHCPWSWASK